MSSAIVKILARFSFAIDRICTWLDEPAYMHELNRCLDRVAERENAKGNPDE